MLNDLRTYTRTMIFFQLVPAGMIIGLLLSSALVPSANLLRAAAIVFVVALLLVAGWAVTAVVHTGRMNARLLTDAQDGTLALISGAIAPAAVVPGRVHLTRTTVGYSTGLLAAGASSPQPADRQIVMTVLPPDDPPRRVAVLGPASVPQPALARGTFHLVALHAQRREVGVLVDRPVDQSTLSGDPRWHGRLPTNNSVVGGYVWLLPLGLAAPVLGALLALGIGWLVR